MVERTALLAGVVIGTVPVSVLYLDGFWDPQLAAVVWGVYALAGVLAFRRRAVLTDNSNRWGTLFAIVVLGGTQFGIHMAPLPGPNSPSRSGSSSSASESPRWESVRNWHSPRPTASEA